MSKVKYVDESLVWDLVMEYKDQLPRPFCNEIARILDGGRELTPHPHGHWIRYESYIMHTNPYMDNYFKRKIVCSHCNHTIHVPERQFWDNYESAACLVCGCLMDDGKKEIHPYV